MTTATTPLTTRAQTGPLPLPVLLRQHASQRPDEIAMRYKRLGIWEEFTWRQVDASVHAIAAWSLTALDESGPIAVSGRNEPEFFWAEFGAQAAGRPAVCMHPELDAVEAHDVLKRTRAQVVFAEDQEQCDKLLEAVQGTAVRHVVFWDGRGLEKYDDPRLVPLATVIEQGEQELARDPSLVTKVLDSLTVDAAAVVVFTSGTKAAPNGVVLSHRFLIDSAMRVDSLLRTRVGGSYVSVVSAAWVSEQVVGVTLGMLKPLIVHFVEDASTVGRDLREVGAQYLYLSPRHWEALGASIDLGVQAASRPARALITWALGVLKSARGNSRRVDRAIAWWLVGRPLRDQLGLSRVEAAMSSGGPVGRETLTLFDALRLDLHNVYCVSEVGVVAGTSSLDDRSSVGHVLDSPYGETPLEVRIAGHEIQVRGAVAPSGYVASVEPTVTLTDDGWFATGDAGHLTEAGELVYLDRLDYVLTPPSGELIAPEDVETNLRLSPFIDDAVVVSVAPGVLDAILGLAEEPVRNWADRQSIVLGSYQQLTQNDAVLELIRDEVVRINAGRPESLRLSRFACLPKKLDPDDGELTRNRKLKRSVILARYEPLVQAFAAGLDTVSLSVDVQLADGRSHTVTTGVRVVGAAQSSRTELSTPASGDSSSTQVGVAR